MEPTLHSARVWKYTLTIFVVLFSVLLTGNPTNATVQNEHLDEVDAIIVEMGWLSADWDNVSDGKPSTSSLTPKLKAKLSNEVRHAAKRLEQARRDLSKDHAEKAYHHLQQSVDALELFQQYLNQALTEGQLDAAAVTRLHQHSDAIIARLQQCLSVLSENHAPVADAGLDQVLDQPGTVNLDGSGSYDQDGDPLQFSWDLTVQPEDSAALLNDASAPTPSFQAEAPGLYQARLIVNDGHYDSEPDTVQITVQFSNAAPVAVAGEDQYVAVGQTVFLDAGASYDTDGDPLSYHWILLSTPASSTAVLSDANQIRSQFTPDFPGQYSLQLIVNDGSENSAPDDLTVYVQAANVPPVADAGPDQSAYLNEQIQLDGSASSDADGDAIAYQWTLLTKPEGSLAELNDPLAVYPQFTLDVSGDYSIQLVVNDGQVDSEPDQVVVSTLNSQPVADAGPDQVLTAGDSLTLDGSASYDADQDPLNYNWSITVQPEQSQVSLPEPSLMQPQVQLTEAGFYVFQLIVDDGHVSSTPDTVNVEVAARPPLQLTLAHPPQDWITNTAAVTFTGHLNQAASLTLNGTAVTLQPDLSFSHSVTLNEGINAFILHADNGLGDSLSLTRTLTLDTQAPVIDASQVTVAQPDAQGQVAITGAVDSVEPYATVTALNVQNNQTQTATALQDGSFNIQFASGVAGDVYVLSAVDVATNQSESIYLNDGTVPMDPHYLAGDLPASEMTAFDQSTAFLYQGENPVQTGVTQGAVDANRTTVLRGVVKDEALQPLSGVSISIQYHPEFGGTLTRQDGQFDMVVNGGGTVVVNYAKSGYLPVQRRITTSWKDFALIDDVIMLQVDSNASLIDLNNQTENFQVAQSNVTSDADGARQATILFPKGTTAVMTLPDGTQQALTTLTVRATEYTVGENGRERMPGPLPPTSAYTYAVELSVDEAIAAGGEEVKYSQPVTVYVDNFLDFPVGEVVPVGYFDRNRSAWIPSENGRVIKILSISNNQAIIDANGDAVADTEAQLAALGITVEERHQLASLYVAGKSLWRFAVTHFTPYDCNWPYGYPADATGPGNNGPFSPSNTNTPLSCPVTGCVIMAENRVLGEDINLPDINFGLHYRSDRAPGQLVSRTLNIPVSGEAVPASLKTILLDIQIAGQRHVQSFPPQPDQSYQFIWDGLDAYGRKAQGSHTAKVRISYQYELVYLPARRDVQRSFARLPGGVEVIARRNSVRAALSKTWEAELSNDTLDPADLGYFSLGVHHVYNQQSGTLYTGDGRKIKRTPIKYGVLTAIHENVFTNPYSDKIRVAPDGSILYTNNRKIFSIAPDGTRTTLVGNGSAAEPGANDGQLATAVGTGVITSFQLGLDGTLYFLETDTLGSKNSFIRHVTAEGILETFSDAYQNYDATDIDVGPDGAVYVTLEAASRVERIDRDGYGETVVDVHYWPWNVSVHPNGTVYASATFGSQIDIVEPNGTKSQIPVHFPNGVTWDKAGNLYIAGSQTNKGENGIYFYNGISAPFRISADASGQAPSEGADIGSVFFEARELHYSEFHGGLLIPYNGKIWLMRDGVDQFTEAGEVAIASENGRQLYIFNVNGQHQKTLDTLTGVVLYQFTYNDAQQPIEIEQQGGNITRIARGPDGTPTALISPDQRALALHQDSNGYLNRIELPENVDYQMTYTDSGLLTGFQDPNLNIYTYQYDTLGQLLQDIAPEGSGWTLNTTYGKNERWTDLTSAEGRITRYHAVRQDNGDLQRLITGPDGAASQIIEKADKSIISTRANGVTTETIPVPDPRFGELSPTGYNTRITTPGGLTSVSDQVMTATLADPGNPFSLVEETKTITVNGKAVMQRYEAATQTQTTTSAEGRTAVTRLDTLGRPQQFALPGLEPMNIEYDSRSRLSRISTGSGENLRETLYAYYPDGPMQGYLESVTNAIGQSTHYQYDLTGRVTHTSLPDNRVIQFSYDANGNLTGLTPPGKPLHQYGYDGLDQTLAYLPPELTGITNPVTGYVYNKDRQLTQINRPDGQSIDLIYGVITGKLDILRTPRGDFNYTYDSITGQLNSIATPENELLSYQYDGFLPTQTQWQGSINGSVETGFNNDFLPEQRCINTLHCIDFSYDNDNLLTQVGNLTLTRDPGNGLITGSTFQAAAPFSTSQTYTAFGELETTGANYNGNSLFQSQYTRDQLGRITQKSETVNGIETVYDYTYDLAGRLETIKQNGIETDRYEYDSNGNRTHRNGQLIAAYDDQDRLTGYQSASYHYTANGELESKTDNSVTTGYAYDTLGNLSQVTLPGDVTIDYLTDAQNRRIGKQVNGQLTQGFLYKDQLNPIAELNGNGQIVARFVYADKANVPAYLIKIDPVTQAETEYRVISDHLGSPRLIVNAQDGGIAQQIEYDAWGNIIMDTNPGFQPFGFAGGIYDVHTGLVRFGARDYDAETGRWTAKDPIRFEGGDANLYGYVISDPVNLIDIDGKSPSLLWQLLGIIAGLSGPPQDGHIDPSNTPSRPGQTKPGSAAGRPLPNPAHGTEPVPKPPYTIRPPSKPPIGPSAAEVVVSFILRPPIVICVFCNPKIFGDNFNYTSYYNSFCDTI